MECVLHRLRRLLGVARRRGDRHEIVDELFHLGVFKICDLRLHLLQRLLRTRCLRYYVDVPQQRPRNRGAEELLEIVLHRGAQREVFPPQVLLQLAHVVAHLGRAALLEQLLRPLVAHATVAPIREKRVLVQGLLQLQQVLDHPAGVHAIPEPPSPHGASVGPVRRDSIPRDVVLQLEQVCLELLQALRRLGHALRGTAACDLICRRTLGLARLRSCPGG
mmetsp:Transcript_69867/g.168989  ORF Transcript_69867/g.168989 Transcript_69867/m.168989 type:complete len:220 (-) Transcript_69867:346-1005(-)